MQMTYSSSLKDREWEVLEPILMQALPARKTTRPLDWSYRQLLDGMLYQLKSGCNWGDLPKDFPPYSTVYWHYKKWRDGGVFDRLLDVLHGQLRVKVKKKVDGPH
jgi:transposase